MVQVDRRVRVWNWFVRRQGSIASRSEAEIAALQARRVPSNPMTNRILGTVTPGTTVEDRTIPGPAGEIPVRVYRPTTGARPLIVHFHGGGFVVGDLRLNDWLCSQVATRVGAVVMSVDYRLAPTHRFPAAVDDSYAAVAWAAEHDPLRDDGARYAAALRAAAVPVRCTEYVGMPHGFLNFPGVCRSAPQALAELCAEQTAALTQPSAVPLA